MKILCASDIHGNREKLKLLTDKCFLGGFDRFIITGDLTGVFGRGLPEFPESVRKICTLALGNCDNEDVIKSCKILYYEDYGVLYADGVNIFYTHGHIYNEFRPVPGMTEGDVFISGHTHIPCIKEKNGILYLNPGSASKPRGGFEPTYMVYDDGNVEIKDFSDNVIMCRNNR